MLKLARLRSQLLFPYRRSIGHSSSRFSKTEIPFRGPGAPSATPEVDVKSKKDFRGPWLYKAVGVANFIIIPVVGIYATFFWDWDDDRAHVMQPARRWLQRQKEKFFRLSPSEQELASPDRFVPLIEGEESESSPDVSRSGLSTAGLPKGFFKPFFLVKEVQPTGPAANAGLRDDDLIVSFGNIPVRSLPPLKYLGMIKAAANGNTPIEVVVMRADKQILLLLTPTQDGGLGCDLQRFQPGQVNR